MKITNTMGLPQAVVDACKLDTYDRGESDITVTQLIGPPQIRVLRALHEDEIVRDVSQMTWALRGKTKHYILELAARASPQVISEKRFYADIDTAALGLETPNGYVKLGGQIDLYDARTQTLWDYKETSVWTYIYQSRTVEWTEQLNVLRWLMHQAGIHVGQLKVCGIWQGWTRHRAGEANYPSNDISSVDIPMWTLEETGEFIDTRLREHYTVPTPLCTDEERWLQPIQYAVVKGGNKRATRNFDMYADAKAFMAKQTGKGWRIEQRGEENNYRRCAEYCDVRPFCAQAQGDGPEQES